MRKSGFTLIELLVVIAIIAILAAILFPVFARAREKARQTSCLSNVKQISLGILMYSQDYDEAFPGFYSKLTTADWPLKQWVHDVMPYVKNEQIFVCPSGGEQNTYGNTPPAAPQFPVSYAVSNWICAGGRGNYNNKMARITHPAETIVLYDAIRAGRWCASPFGHNPTRSRQDDCEGRPAGICKLGGGSLVAGGDYSRHNEGANVGFCDGHAKWLRNGTWEWYPENYAKYWQKSR